ncbi:hypothetical protein F0562_017801 [Nyssa sinensis]|uniref:Uncharacterized protein n=1 Tax=Nyssa sinensis TaxID=561372 RepID=A0A5J4ZHK4_9ASTE|nr:hypothetical protein F0562_017801 [Nyssa sinensis]
MRLRQAQEIIEELLKPVDESQDYIKRQQLRELAMLNSNFREDSPGPSAQGSSNWIEFVGLDKISESTFWLTKPIDWTAGTQKRVELIIIMGLSILNNY